MDGQTQRAAVSWDNGTLAPVDNLRLERADSPMPGLVEGTEPGEVVSQFDFHSRENTHGAKNILRTCC